MSIVGQVESVWRYPVKSMRGEELAEAFVGFAGVYGDRLFAFRSSARPKGSPTSPGASRRRCCSIARASVIRTKLRDRPIWPQPRRIAPGLTPLSADPADLALEVETPAGEVLAWRTPLCSACLASGSATGMR